MGNAEAFIRGCIISSSAHLAKTRNARQQQFIGAILDIDRQQASTLDPVLAAKRLQLQNKFDLLSTNKAEHLLWQKSNLFRTWRQSQSALSLPAQTSTCLSLHFTDIWPHPEPYCWPSKHKFCIFYLLFKLLQTPASTWYFWYGVIS